MYFLFSSGYLLQNGKAYYLEFVYCEEYKLGKINNFSSHIMKT
jgi:hypothetical protein